MIRAVIDTNIVISGIFFGGVPLKILNAAMNRKFTHVLSARCSYIVTGDRRDLLSLKKYQHIEITTAKDFLKML